MSSWKQIKNHAKKHGQEVVTSIVSALDKDLDRSGWAEDEKKLYRETVLETIKRFL